jgi:multidrug efflux pump subunit AcrA (membrane-fusion protein)
MSTDATLSLPDCLEFRQTLMARPPALVHGSAALLTVLVAAALAWAALTPVDLVVRAPGRVRPVSVPRKVVCAARGEVFSASAGVRVVAVHVRPGSEVRRGEVLLRLGTERLDQEIARRQGTIRTGAEELARLAGLEALLQRQFEAARAKALAELAQADEEVRQARERQTSDVRLAELERKNADDEEATLRRLLSHRAASAADVIKASARAREAREKLAKLRLPVEDGKVTVLRQALALTEKDFAVRGEELALKKRSKQGEVEAARIELTSLELERQQAAVLSPLDGVVTAGEVKVGDVLEPGKPVLEIAEQQGFLFEALVPSEEVGHLKAGMPARIKLDAYDYQRYGTLPGEVVFLSPDSEVVEGQRPAVYLVKIAVAGDEVGRGDLRGQVKLGMAGQAEIVTGQESVLSLLIKRIRQSVSLG